MASLKFILKTQKLDKTGKCPLYIRLIQNRNTKLISTGIKLEAAQWDEDRQRVKKNYPNSSRMNAVLASKLAEASIQVLDEERKSKNITATKLKESLIGANSVNFFSYADKNLTSIREQISGNTYTIYKSQIRKFQEFVGSDNLLLENMTVNLIKDYTNHNINIKKNKIGSAKSSLIPLSSIYSMAVNEGLIPSSSCPFGKIRFKLIQSKRNYLNKEQLQSLVDYKCKANSKDDLFRNMFVFAVSAAGLRFSDVVTLQWKYIDLETSIIERRIIKTGRIHRLKMGPLAAAVINKYRTLNPNPDDLVFPALSKIKYEKADHEKQRKMVLSSNQLANLYLRKIGADLKLPFRLHFHLSRHTFATQALSNGMRIEYVSKLMDHTKISTTQIYAKVIDEDLDKAVDQFVI